MYKEHSCFEFCTKELSLQEEEKKVGVNPE
jgi:hypothetical protein